MLCLRCLVMGVIQKAHVIYNAVSVCIECVKALSVDDHTVRVNGEEAGKLPSNKEIEAATS